MVSSRSVRGPRGLVILRRDFATRFYHLIQNFFKVLEASGGNYNIVAPAIDILRDSKKTSARVFFQRKNKSFSFDLDLVSLESVFIYRRFWNPGIIAGIVGTIAIRRGTFV